MVAMSMEDRDRDCRRTAIGLFHFKHLSLAAVVLVVVVVEVVITSIVATTTTITAATSAVIHPEIDHTETIILGGVIITTPAKGGQITCTQAQWKTHQH